MLLRCEEYMKKPTLHEQAPGFFVGSNKIINGMHVLLIRIPRQGRPAACTPNDSGHYISVIDQIQRPALFDHLQGYLVLAIG